MKSFELAAYRAFGPLLLASGMACNGLVKVGDICRTRGYIVVQRDIYLSDKGTFICRTRGHFLSDKGTFSKNQPVAPAGQWGKISI